MCTASIARPCSILRRADRALLRASRTSSLALVKQAPYPKVAPPQTVDESIDCCGSERAVVTADYRSTMRTSARPTETSKLILAHPILLERISPTSLYVETGQYQAAEVEGAGRGRSTHPKTARAEVNCREIGEGQTRLRRVYRARLDSPACRRKCGQSLGDGAEGRGSPSRDGPVGAKGQGGEAKEKSANRSSAAMSTAQAL